MGNSATLGSRSGGDVSDLHNFLYGNTIFSRFFLLFVFKISLCSNKKKKEITTF